VETAELTWRPLRIEDAPALARAWALIEAVDGTGEHFSAQDVRDELEDELLDVGRDTLGGLGPGGDFVAFVRVHGPATAGDVDLVFADGGVVPAARGRGLGRRLLDWAEERAATLHRERHPDVPGAVCVYVQETNASKDALVRAAGYEATRWEYTMVHALEEPLPAIPPTPSGLVLTPYAADRDEAVRQSHHAAFSGHWGFTAPDEQRWLRWYTGSRAFRPELSRLLLDGDAVAAFLLGYFWEADAAATGVREAFVGQLGVRPEWRRRGVGQLLLATALRSYRDAGYDRAALNVDTANPSGALRLYERVGFTVRNTYVTWTKPLP